MNVKAFCLPCYPASDDHWPEIMLPVPLHNKRLRERSYDQTLLLTRALKKQLHTINLDIDTRLIKRIINSVPQQSLDAIARQKDIRNAYILNRKSGWKHVVIINDVVETGAKLNEITWLLKRNNVERVARTSES